MWMWLWTWFRVGRWYDSEILLLRVLSSSHLRPRLRAGLVSIPPVDTMGLAVGRCYRFSRECVSGYDPCFLEASLPRGGGGWNP